MSKYEGNELIKNKNLTQISRNQTKLDIELECQGH